MDLLQVAATSVGAFVALFLLSKLMGHRQISELSVFDYVNGITIGSIAAEMATELEKPLRPLMAMVVWALLVCARGADEQVSAPAQIYQRRAVDHL